MQSLLFKHSNTLEKCEIIQIIASIACWYFCYSNWIVRRRFIHIDL